MNVNFCFEPATISGMKFIDQDGDCSFEPAGGDLPAVSVTVDLYLDVDNDGVLDMPGDTFIVTDTTDASGNYSFSGLTAGNYIVDCADTGGVLDWPAAGLL